MESIEHYSALIRSQNITDIVQAVPFLKEQGANQMRTVRVLMQVFNLSLAEADSYVLNADAWKENLDLNKTLRDAFWAGD